MDQLSDAALRAAIDYNNRRKYPEEVWLEVQERVGASVDGVPGEDTARKVAETQGDLDLEVDGKVGSGTLAAFGIELGTFDAIVQLPGDDAFFFSGKLAVDADGAPNAYHPKDTGIDFLANAGRPGNWWGVATDDSGDPYIQGADDPFPGYYVSTTALADARHVARDPRRYVDATEIPYFVLGRNVKDLVHAPDLRKGDLGAVVRVGDPQRVVFAIYGDVGPTWTADHVPGEGSVALAEKLGHDPYVDGRVRRGISSGVFFVVFPGSGERRPLPKEEIESLGRRHFEAWGGQSRLQNALETAGVA